MNLKKHELCFVVGACCSNSKELYFPQSVPHFVIAADGGLSYLEELQLQPDLIVGDFDSLGRLPTGKEVLCHPPEKDDTDMALAVAEGFSRGYSRFVLYGGMGGRPDHTFANIQLLASIACRGGEGYLWSDGHIITVIKDSAKAFGSSHSGFFSVFCLGDTAEGVTLTGLKYLLDDATLTGTVPLGVSNEFTGTFSSVQVRKGMLALFWNSPAKELVENLYNNNGEIL